MHMQLQLRKAFGRRHTIMYNYRLQFIAFLYRLYRVTLPVAIQWYIQKPKYLQLNVPLQAKARVGTRLHTCRH